MVRVGVISQIQHFLQQVLPNTVATRSELPFHSSCIFGRWHFIRRFVLHHTCDLCPLKSFCVLSKALQEVLQVKLKGRRRERQFEVLENGRVHDAEAADLLRLLAGELEEDGGGVAGEVGGVCCLR